MSRCAGRTDEECSDAEWTLARRLAEHPWRLVVIGERATDQRIVAEVAHEALLRAWPRLAEWLRNERDFLIFKGDAERAERRWCGMGGADSALLTGFDLTRAEGWLPSRSQDLSREVVAFAQQSVATFNLGVLYENGHGVAQDYDKAAEWFEKSPLASTPHERLPWRFSDAGRRCTPHRSYAAGI